MATPPDILDQAQLRSLVAWLEEQRKADREEIARLSGDLERLTLAEREQAAQLAELRTELDRGRQSAERIPLLDDAVLQIREQFNQVLERVDAQGQNVTQALGLRAADAERDRRQVADVVQTVARLEHEAQLAAGRLTAVGEELKRLQAQTTDIPKSLGEQDGKIAALAHRASQIEDQARRLDAANAAARQELDAIRTDQAKAAQWQQLADLRWSRHLTEWQQTVEMWRQTAEEQNRPVQQLVQQLGQLREELRAAQGGLADQQRRADELAGAIARAEAAAAQQREALARLDQALEGQRRRFDEQASAQLRLDDSLGRATGQYQSLERMLEEHARTLADLTQGVRAGEAAAARLREALDDRQNQLRGELELARGAWSADAEQLREALRSAEATVRDLGRAAAEQRQRLAAELERQASELQELTPRDRPG